MTQVPNKRFADIALWAKLGRPQNAVYPGLLAALFAYHVVRSIGVSIVCYATIFGLYALAAGYNNLKDIKTDRLNKRQDNPLVNTGIGALNLRQFYVSHIVLILLLQLLLKQPMSLIFTSVYIALLISYSHSRIALQSRGIVAIVCLAVCYGSLPALLGLAQGQTVNNPHLLWVALVQLFILSPMLLGKDYKDLLGDRKTNKLTYLVRHGARTTQFTALVLLVLLGVILGFLSTHYTIVWDVWFVLGVYAALTVYFHIKQGRVPHMYARLTQILALWLSWGLIALKAYK